MLASIDDPAGELSEDETWVERETKNLKIFSIAKSMASQRPDVPVLPFDPSKVEETLQSLVSETEDRNESGNGARAGPGRRPNRRKTKTKNSLGFELETERVITEDDELSPDERAKHMHYT